ncbi:MAG: sulfurtransferase complex subunit TusB [Methylococcaceae bacterium]
MLHLIFQSPIQTSVLERIGPGDDVMFLENAVLRTLQKGNLSETLAQLLKHNRLYVLADDLVVRGIATDDLTPGLEVIDYSELVALTVKNPVIQSWS